MEAGVKVVNGIVLIFLFPNVRILEKSNTSISLRITLEEK